MHNIEQQAVEEEVKPLSKEEPVLEVDDTPEPEKEVKLLLFEQNVIQESEVFIPMEKKEWVSNNETVAFPSNTQDIVVEAINKAPNVDLTDSEESRKWAKVMSDSMRVSSFNDTFGSTIRDPDAEFHQGIESSAGMLGGTHPKFKAIENENIKGERGVLRFTEFMGLGTIFQAPLWHSGIWITFKAPREADLLELQRQFVNDKIELGRQSYGLIFSNTSSFVTDRLVSFALDHVYTTTLTAEDSTREKLKSIISSQDIPAIMWGLACAMYPRGFQYQRACTAEPDKCNHVVEERLNLTKVLWVNKRSLTPWQIAHMSQRRSNSVTVDSVNRYKNEMLKSQNREITLNKGSSKESKVVLRIPNVNEFIDSGHRWISEIISTVNRSLGGDINDAERNDYIDKHGKASSMRQYLHWVESFDFGTLRAEDRETLEKMFDVLSSDDIVRVEFMDSIQKYINETAITVIGIPVYDCPKCGTPQDLKLPLPKHTNIIPFDVFQTFFILLVQKLGKLTDR